MSSSDSGRQNVIKTLDRFARKLTNPRYPEFASAVDIVMFADMLQYAERYGEGLTAQERKKYQKCQRAAVGRLVKFTINTFGL